jgi:4-hydroxymandelate oxidase
MTLDLQELEERARGRLPRNVYDFYAGGAGDELTLTDNVAAWARVRLRPRILRDVGDVRTEVSALGVPVGLPLLGAPMAFQRVLHPDGERAMARGIGAAGSLMIVSTRSSIPLEEVAEELAGTPWWFQVYCLRDRGLTEELVGRATAAGCRALVLTGDTPFVGTRRRDPLGHFSLPDDMYMPSLVVGDSDEDGIRTFQDPTVTLEAVAWLHGLSGLPVLVKGVLRGDDAAACVEAGAAGVVVSNHGGRQLDGVIATATALPEVVEAVDGRAEVYVDGGIRRGSDALRALALGARAVLVGRPLAWGLAAGGADGVHEVLAHLAEELRLALALAGVPAAADVPRDLIAPG